MKYYYNKALTTEKRHSFSLCRHPIGLNIPYDKHPFGAVFITYNNA